MEVKGGQRFKLSHLHLKLVGKVKPWNIGMPLIFVMGSKKWWSCKVAYRMHTLGDFPRPSPKP
jgi:hypothetical protein